MNETISRAAGAAYGQEMPPERMEALIRAAGRRPLQRTTIHTRSDRAPRHLSQSSAFSTNRQSTPALTPWSIVPVWPFDFVTLGITALIKIETTYLCLG